MNKLDIISPKVVQLILDDGEAEAATRNPHLGFIKFILTDDLPNGNGKRIPMGEFDNLIMSGINMPIKVAGGTIRPGHEGAFPIGTITNLTKENNTIVGLAGLWKKERPEDFKMLKEAYDKGNPLNISWEISYSEASKNEDGIEDLHGTSLSGATFVGIPAYKGRTRVIAFASSKLTESYLSTLPDSAFLYTDKDGNRYFPYKDREDNVDIELINECLNILNSEDSKEIFSSELQTKLITDANEVIKIYNHSKEVALDELEKLKITYKELEDKYKLIVDEFDNKKQEFSSVEEELKTLREFKNSIEAEKEKVAKFNAIKEKFTAANLEMGDDYFEQKKETLLSLSSEALDFFVQELVAFASTTTENKNSSASQLPKMFNRDNNIELKSPADIAKALRKSQNK